MKEVVEYIVKSLVSDKEAVTITEAEENGEIRYGQSYWP